MTTQPEEVAIVVAVATLVYRLVNTIYDYITKKIF